MVAEPSVEDTGREPVPREEELKRGDVPAGHALLEQTNAELRPRVAPQRRTRPRARPAARRQALGALELAYSDLGARPEDAVDRARVERVQVQPDLQRRHIRIAHRRRSGRPGHRHTQSERERQNSQPTHPRSRYRQERPRS